MVAPAQVGHTLHKLVDMFARVEAQLDRRKTLPSPSRSPPFFSPSRTSRLDADADSSLELSLSFADDGPFALRAADAAFNKRLSPEVFYISTFYSSHVSFFYLSFLPRSPCTLESPPCMHLLALSSLHARVPSLHSPGTPQAGGEQKCLLECLRALHNLAGVEYEWYRLCMQVFHAFDTQHDNILTLDEV
jgi:hypothetical protein